MLLRNRPALAGVVNEVLAHTHTWTCSGTEGMAGMVVNEVHAHTHTWTCSGTEGMAGMVSSMRCMHTHIPGHAAAQRA